MDLLTNVSDPLHMTDNVTVFIPISQDIMQSKQVKVALIFMYCIIFLLGIAGNLLVIYVVLRNKTMQTITNLFITNLAFSDILMCLLAVPFTPLAYLLQNWVFGDALCHILPFVICICIFVSSLTSTAIAIDRYFAIVFPFKSRMKVHMCLLLIIAIWIISISISLPLGIYQKVSDGVCSEIWPRDQTRQFYTITSLFLQYVVPCSVITFCYIKVSLALRRRSKLKIGLGTKSREKNEVEIKRKRRTNKMLIAMVIIFVMCWLPLNIVHILREFPELIEYPEFYPFVFFSAHLIAMSSTIYNPFLYAWMNENFKKEFKLVLPCLYRNRPEPITNCNMDMGNPRLQILASV